MYEIGSGGLCCQLEWIKQMEKYITYLIQRISEVLTLVYIWKQKDFNDVDVLESRLWYFQAV